MATDAQGGPVVPTSEYRKVAEDGIRQVAASQTIRHRIDGGSPPIHNFDGDKLAQFRLITLATSGLCKPGKDALNQPIDLKYFYCHLVEMEAKVGGELFDAYRVVLVDKAGDAYGFVSTGILDGLETVIQCFGVGPWTDPMVVKIMETNTRKGNRTYNLIAG